MILVDTSVLIDFFKGVENSSTEQLNTILRKNLPFGINHFIYQELLQGSKTDRDFKLLKKYLDTQVFYDFKNGRESYSEAAKIFITLRKKGITIRGTVDCLIARMAIENDLFLLHNDDDFNKIRGCFSLKIWDL